MVARQTLNSKHAKCSTTSFLNSPNSAKIKSSNFVEQQPGSFPGKGDGSTGHVVSSIFNCHRAAAFSSNCHLSNHPLNLLCERDSAVCPEVIGLLQLKAPCWGSSFETMHSHSIASASMLPVVLTKQPKADALLTFHSQKKRLRNNSLHCSCPVTRTVHGGS